MNGITLVLSCILFLYCQPACTLFIPTPSKKELFTEDTKEPLKQKMILQGILFRHDTQEWVVWIDGRRYDSKFLRSFNKWIIIEVNEQSVLLQHESGMKRTLFLEQ